MGIEPLNVVEENQPAAAIPARDQLGQAEVEGERVIVDPPDLEARGREVEPEAAQRDRFATAALADDGGDPDRRILQQPPDAAHQGVVEAAPQVPIAKDAEPGRVVLEGIEALRRDPALARVAAFVRRAGDAIVLDRPLARPQVVAHRQQARRQGTLVELDLIEDAPGPEPGEIVVFQELHELGHPLGMLDLGRQQVAAIDLEVDQQSLQLRGRQPLEPGRAAGSPRRTSRPAWARRAARCPGSCPAPAAAAGAGPGC